LLTSRKSFFVLLLQLTQTALGAATVIFLARLLPTDDYGKYVYFFTAGSVLPLFTGLGGEHVFLMQGSRHSKLIPYLFGSALFVRVVLTVLCALIAALFLFLRHVDQAAAIILILLGCLLTVFSNPLFLSFYRVKGIQIRPWLFLFTNPLSFIVYLLVLPRSLVSLRAAALGFLLAQVLPLCLFLIDMTGRVQPRVSWRYIKKYSKTGALFSLSQSFDYVFSRLDIFLIQFALGPYSVGIYAAGQRVVSLFQLIPSSFHVVELPEFHRAAAKNPLMLVERFRNLRRLLCELAFLFFGLLILNSRFVVDFLFNERYRSASTVVVLLSLSSILLFINYPYYMLGEAINKIRERLFARIYTFLLTIVLVFVLLRYSAINGAALGMVLGQLGFLFLLHRVTAGYNAGLLGLLSDTRSFVIGALALAFAFLCGRALHEGFAKVILVSVLYTLIYVVLGSWLKLVTSLGALRQLRSERSLAEQASTNNAQLQNAE